jgi:hypothetical protein
MTPTIADLARAKAYRSAAARGFIAASAPAYPVPVTGEISNGRPIVLVAAPTTGAATRAELVEVDATRPRVVRVIYCDSRTSAWVARARVVAPQPTAPLPFDVADDLRIEQMIALGGGHDHDATPGAMLACDWAAALAEDMGRRLAAIAPLSPTMQLAMWLLWLPRDAQIWRLLANNSRHLWTAARWPSSVTHTALRTRGLIDDNRILTDLGRAWIVAATETARERADFIADGLATGYIVRAAS